MANHVSHAALPFPIKNARFTIEVPYLNTTGVPTDPTTPDTEFAVDAGTFADCAEEVTTIAGVNGTGYITLTGAETNGSMVAIAAKVASGPNTTLATIYPRVLPAIVSAATLSAGSASGGTLTTALAYDITGCFVRTVGGTGGGGTGGASNQARKITSYNTSTGVFGVTPNWETALDATTTVDILLPEGMTLGALRALNPATAGRTIVVDAAGLADANTVKLGPSGSGTAQTARDVGGSVLLSAGTGAGQLDFASGVVKANVVQMLATAFTESGAGRLVAGFKKFFDVVTPASTMEALTLVATTTNLSNAPLDSAGVGTLLTRLSAARAAMLDALSLRTGTAQAGAASTITLDASASATNDLYKRQWIVITGGTGAGQSRLITGYVGATKVATVHVAWAVNPDNTSVFYLLSASDIYGLVLADTTTALTNAPPDSTGITSLLAKFTGITLVAQWLGLLAGKQTGDTTARTEIRATGAGSGTFDETTDSQEALRDRGDAAWITGTTPPTVAAIVNGVWDEAMAGHATAGTAGAELAAAGGSGDPWATLIPGSYGAGTAGNILGNKLDAKISDARADIAALKNFDPATQTVTLKSGTHTGAVIPTTTNVTNDVGITQAGADKAWSTTTRALTDKSNFRLSAVGVQDIWDALTSVLTTANSIGKLLTDNVNATISSRLLGSSYTAPDNASISAIKLQTDKMVFTVAGIIDANVVDWKGSTAPANTGDAYGLLNSAQAEPSAVPAANVSPIAKLGYLYAKVRNKRIVTATADRTRNDADNADIASATLADDGTTFTKGKDA